MARTFPRTEAPGRRTSHRQVSGERSQPPRGKQKEPSLSQELYQEPAPGPAHLRVQEHFPTVVAQGCNSTSLRLNRSFHRQMHSIGIRSQFYILTPPPPSPFQADEPISPTNVSHTNDSRLHNGSEPGSKKQKPKAGCKTNCMYMRSYLCKLNHLKYDRRASKNPLLI